MGSRGYGARTLTATGDGSARRVVRMALGAMAMTAGGAAFTRWHGLRRVATERRRISHALHDELAQDTRFVAETLEVVLRRSDDPQLRSAAHAADRACATVRLAVNGLSRPTAAGFETELRQVLEEIQDRYDAEVSLRLEQADELPQRYHLPLLQITREAAVNAARHGRAQQIQVELSRPGPWVLDVSDDGDGFRRDRRPDRMGLTIMRERALAVDGSFEVSTDPGNGSRVRVRLP